MMTEENVTLTCSQAQALITVKASPPPEPSQLGWGYEEGGRVMINFYKDHVLYNGVRMETLHVKGNMREYSIYIPSADCGLRMQ